jgi:hypothetical protein
MRSAQIEENTVEPNTGAGESKCGRQKLSVPTDSEAENPRAGHNNKHGNHMGERVA